MCTGEKRGKQMNQTELPECEKINKKEPSKDVQMTQEQADRLVEHLKNIIMYVPVLRPEKITQNKNHPANGKMRTSCLKREITSDSTPPSIA